MSELERGDRVTWKSYGGTAYGRVEKKQESDTPIEDRVVRTSKDVPHYIVRSDNGGKAAHKRRALHKA